MSRAVCPGSFDPVTLGHLDIFERSAALFDDVIIAVLVNDAKRGVFTVDERVELLNRALEDRGVRCEVTSFSGLLVDFCRVHQATVIVKGVRSPADVTAELGMAQMNKHLSGVDTVLLPTDPRYGYVSSSLVREIAGLGGDVAGLVPQTVIGPLANQLGARPGTG